MAMLGDVLLSCCGPDESKQQRFASRAIDRQLQKDKNILNRTVKILLLGSGESGKTTFLKQMRIINGVDFAEEELKQFKLIVYSNIVKGMKVMIDARDKLGIPWEDDANDKEAFKIFSFDLSIKLEEPIFAQFVRPLVELWKDAAVQTVFHRRREFQLGDSIKYFLDDVERIGQIGYIPTTLDILHARKATKGVAECEFLIHNVPFRFVDVGGQRSQRQRWYQCFADVTSILFMASSSEFDQVLFEDRQTNRLVESCNIFETIVNNRAFSQISIILFLNKTDLLMEKICTVDISDYFSQFFGNARSLTDVQQFELTLFNERRIERSQQLFSHFTTAIDTKNIQLVFKDVHDTILSKNVQDLLLQ